MCKQYFFPAPFIKYSGLFVKGKSPLAFLPGGISWAGSCPRIVAQGELTRKMFRVPKIQGENCYEGNLMGEIVRKLMGIIEAK